MVKLGPIHIAQLALNIYFKGQSTLDVDGVIWVLGEDGKADCRISVARLAHNGDPEVWQVDGVRKISAYERSQRKQRNIATVVKNLLPATRILSKKGFNADKINEEGFYSSAQLWRGSEYALPKRGNSTFGINLTERPGGGILPLRVRRQAAIHQGVCKATFNDIRVSCGNGLTSLEEGQQMALAFAAQNDLAESIRLLGTPDKFMLSGLKQDKERVPVE